MDQICEAQPATDPMQQDVQQKHYAGVRRLGYFGGMLGLSVLQRVCDAPDKGEPTVAFVGFAVVVILALALVVSRLRNIGMNAGWSLLALVPIAGCYVLIKCLVCPEGYEDTKRLDRTGKGIAGICITFVLLCALGILAAIAIPQMSGSPSTCGAAVKEDWSQFKPVQESIPSNSLHQAIALTPKPVVQSTPSSRLAGRWRNVDNGNEIIYSPVDQLGTGTYRLCNKPSGITGPAFRFKVISEYESGTQLFIRDLKENHPAIQELSARGWSFSKSDIHCSISKDGQEMTQEYTSLRSGERSFSVYQKVDTNPQTEGESAIKRSDAGSSASYGQSTPSASEEQENAKAEMWKAGEKELQQTFGPFLGIAEGPNGPLAYFERISQPVHNAQVVRGYEVSVRPDGVTFTKNGLGWVWSLSR